MTTTDLSIIDSIGLGLMIALSFALAIMFTSYVIGRRAHPIRLGVVQSSFFALWYLGNDLLLRIVPFEVADTDILLGEQIAASLFWMSLAWTIDIFIRQVFWYGILASKDGTRAPHIIRNATTVALYLTALIVILYYVLGLPVTGLVASSGMVAFIFGYAAQSTLGELFSGIGLSLAPPYAEGDMIDVDGDWGTVVDSNWRAITVIDRDGNQVTYPNSKIASAKVRNFDKPQPHLRRGLLVEISYDAPPMMVTAVMNEAMEKCPIVLESPRPHAEIDGAGEFGLRYIVYYHMANSHDWFPSATEVMSAIWYALKRHDIAFAFDRRGVAGPERRATEFVSGSAFDPESREDLHAIFEGVEILAPLTQADRRELAQKAERLVLGPPEPVIKQGEDGSSLYIVASGSVGIYISMHDGQDVKVATLTAGAFFGEMSLLTGEKRSATARAEEECVLYELCKEHLEPVLNKTPDMVTEIARVVANRQMDSDRNREAYASDRNAKSNQKYSLTLELTQKILTFFGLHQAS